MEGTWPTADSRMCSKNVNRAARLPPRLDLEGPDLQLRPGARMGETGLEI
jgi:hypothetical protein